ncbi:MAG: 50S ribosomal protein L32 [Armatimonadetes bacterium]|nr:50S ribosomal protein L32 [Armatimonadota bacterium]
MPQPKRRHSHSRKNKRRSQWRVKPPQLIACPDCRALRLAHRACPACGNYAGVNVVTVRPHIHRGRGS